MTPAELASRDDEEVVALVAHSIEALNRVGDRLERYTQPCDLLKG